MSAELHAREGILCVCALAHDSRCAKHFGEADKHWIGFITGSVVLMFESATNTVPYNWVLPDKRNKK